ncbi:hypothetical protein P7C70_g6680, partial [Phenoliferia sp. Uapishka_3]
MDHMHQADDTIVTKPGRRGLGLSLDACKPRAVQKRPGGHVAPEMEVRIQKSPKEKFRYPSPELSPTTPKLEYDPHKARLAHLHPFQTAHNTHLHRKTRYSPQIDRYAAAFNDATSTSTERLFSSADRPKKYRKRSATTPLFGPIPTSVDTKPSTRQPSLFDADWTENAAEEEEDVKPQRPLAEPVPPSPVSPVLVNTSTFGPSKPTRHKDIFIRRKPYTSAVARIRDEERMKGVDDPVSPAAILLDSRKRKWRENAIKFGFVEDL